MSTTTPARDDFAEAVFDFMEAGREDLGVGKLNADADDYMVEERRVESILRAQSLDALVRARRSAGSPPPPGSTA